MSLDRSLKSAGALARHRNVLSRPERIEKLHEKDKFDLIGGNPLGLPKVGNRKVKTAKATAKKEAVPGAAGVAAPGAAAGAAAPGAGAAPAAGAKGAAATPGAGAKAATPGAAAGDKKAAKK